MVAWVWLAVQARQELFSVTIVIPNYFVEVHRVLPQRHDLNPLHHLCHSFEGLLFLLQGPRPTDRNSRICPHQIKFYILPVQRG